MSTSIGSATATQRPEFGGHHGDHGRMKQVMAGAASALGMSDDDLKDALRSGKTLADLGKEKGVSTDDLIAAVKSGLEQAGPPQGAQGAQGAQAPDLTQMATDIVNGTGPAGRGHGPHHGSRAGGDGDGDGDDMAQRLQSVTSALGMDETSFFDALASGTSLKDLASQHNVSSDQLKSLLMGPVAVNTTA